MGDKAGTVFPSLNEVDFKVFGFLFRGFILKQILEEQGLRMFSFQDIMLGLRFRMLGFGLGFKVFGSASKLPKYYWACMPLILGIQDLVSPKP